MYEARCTEVDPIFSPCQAQIFRMKQQPTGGSIVCTASVAGICSGAGDSAYSASKAAVISLVKVTPLEPV